MFSSRVRRNAAAVALCVTLGSLLAASPAAASSRTTTYESPYSSQSSDSHCVQDSAEIVCTADGAADKAAGTLRVRSDVRLPPLSGGSAIAYGSARLQHPFSISRGVTSFTVRIDYAVLEASAHETLGASADAMVRLRADVADYGGYIANTTTVLADTEGPPGSRAPLVITVQAAPGTELKGNYGVWVTLASRAMLYGGPRLTERVSHASANVDVTSIEVTS